MQIWNLIKSLLTSKKLVVMVAGLIVAFAARKGLSLDETEVAGILAMFISYILAQGQADKGKEAVKVGAIAEVQKESLSTPDEKIAAIKSAA